MESRSTHDAQQLSDNLGELSILLPALREALQRDQGGGDTERVHTSNGHLSLPLNGEVLIALRTLDAQVPAMVYRAASVLGEPTSTTRSIEGHLLHIPRLHERLLATAAQAEAVRLAKSLAYVLRETKLAIGLLIRDRGIGHECPLHDADRVELVVPGDVGHLQYRRLVAGVPEAPQVSWLHTDAIVCRICDASWVPAQYMLLGRMLIEAQQRRAGEAA